MVQPWVTFAILPVFALLNAGVAIAASAIRSLASPVPLGIIAGLVIGKPVGICLTSWLAVKVGLVAGIGFTMALFISGLAFPGTDLESEAKLGILLASLLAAAGGIAILLTTQRQADPIPA